MIARYLSFDITKYLKDYYYYLEVIDSLEAKYNDLDGLKAINPAAEKVQEKPTEFEVEKIAIQRVELSRKIADYREHITTCQRALQRLTEEEQKVIDCFFNPKTEVDFYEMGLSQASAYRIRKEALEKLSLFIVGTENVK